MNKAISWARVSTKSQEDEGYSLNAQAKIVQDYAARRDLTIVKNFAVPESARGKQERVEFIKMLEYLEENKDIKTLLCEKVDRISRNFTDALKIDEWLNRDPERQIHFVKQSLVIHQNSKSNEKFQWDIYLVMARQYSNNLSEEARKGLSQKAEQGWYPGNQKRGYKLIINNGQKIWAIDDSVSSEATFIKKAFEMYDTDEYTTITLSNALFIEGWKAPSGKPVSKSSIHKVLTDCFYCGEFDYKGRRYTNAKHEPLVSRELFSRVQDKIHKKLTGKYKNKDFMFSTLIKCAECGRSVVAETQKGHHYYHCTRYNTNCSQKKYIRSEVLEDQILEKLEALQLPSPKLAQWVEKALKESHVQKTEYHNSTMAELSRQQVMIQQRIDALYDDKLDGKISLEFYNKKIEQYNKQLFEASAAVQLHQSASVDYLALGVAILELSQKAKIIYNQKTTPEDKRMLLNFVFSDIKLNDGKLEATYNNAFQIIASRSRNTSLQAIVEEVRTAILFV